LGLLYSGYADRRLSALDPFDLVNSLHDVLERLQVVQFCEDDYVVLPRDGVNGFDPFDLRKLSSDLPRFALLNLNKDVDTYLHKSHRERIRTQS